MIENYAEEILDLVDGNDQVIGTISHEEAFNLPKDGGKYLRAAHALIVNSKGQIWIPRRTAAKRIKPGGLDHSVAEHVASGEDYLTAIVRGFEEELHLQSKPEVFIETGKTFPEPGGIPYISVDYVVFSDTTPEDYSRDDFDSAEWIDPTTLLQRLDNGEVAKEDLANSVRLLINYITV